MPSVTYDGQSFLQGGRRLWLVGAAVEYAALRREAWQPVLSTLRQAGFNAIRTSAPWHLHEPSPGTFRFEGNLDVAAFIGLAAELGMMVLLRVGPAVGSGWSGSGLPAWLGDEPGLRPREPEERFRRRVAAWYGQILEAVKTLQAASHPGDDGVVGGGALVAVQVEHDWNCGNEEAGQEYLPELVRFARERGVVVPICTSNGLWVSTEGTVELWEGGEDVMAHMRQLRHVAPDSPRIVELGMPDAEPRGPVLLRRMVEALAAGAQPIVAQAVPTLVDAAGVPQPALAWARRVAAFASCFGHAFADAAGDAAATVADPASLGAGQISVCPLRGDAGRMAFVFRGAGAKADPLSLLMPDGLRTQAWLGDSPAACFAFDLDLQGRGRLDHCSLPVHALVDRTTLVVYGPPETQGVVSVDNREVAFRTPGADAGAMPTVTRVGDFTLVACTTAQLDASVLYGRQLLLGVRRVLPEGAVELAAGFRGAVRVEGGRATPVPAAWVAQGPAGRTARSVRAKTGVRGRGAGDDWHVMDAAAFVDGSSPRYATVKLLRSLGAWGNAEGRGWYRVTVAPARRSRLLWPLHAAGRIHAWRDGAALGCLNDGERLPLELGAGAGAAITFLVSAGVRPAAGVDQAVPPGVGGLVEAEPLPVKAKSGATPASPVAGRRAFVPGFPGALSAECLELSFSLKAPAHLILAVSAPGPLALLSGPQIVETLDPAGRGPGGALLAPSQWPGWKPGAQVLRIAGLAGTPAPPASAVRLLSVQGREDAAGGAGSGGGAGVTWAFARWDPPPQDHQAWTRMGAALPAGPCWLRCSAPADGVLRLPAGAAGPGTVFVDGVEATQIPEGATSVELGTAEGRCVTFLERGAAARAARVRSRRGARSS